MTNPVLDAFAAEPGVSSGRILPSGVIPSDGSFVFCLGCDEPGTRSFLRPGDFVEVSQTGALPSGNVFSFQARTRAPHALPPAVDGWKASVLVDGSEVGQRALVGSSAFVDWEWFVDVAGLTGSHAIAFRLTLTGPSLPGAPPDTNLPVVEVEIPAFYVDAIAFSTIGAAPFITNETPTANQGQGVGTAPPDSTTIDFDCFGLGTNVDATTIHVTLNGVDAILAGVVQSGFHGTVGASAEVVHVSVAPSLPFSSDSVVTVHVVAQRVGAGSTNSRTWTFRVADTTAPLMTFVQALGPQQVRVTWSKAILASDPTAPHDGLDASLYYLEAIQPDSLTPVVDGGPSGTHLPAPYVVIDHVLLVSAGPPTVVDLFTNVELTSGVLYRLTEVGVADAFGNAITSALAFQAFDLPRPLGRTFDLYRLLPRLNRQEDVTADLLKFIRCIQEPANLLLYSIDTWTSILDVDVAPEPFLDAMLEDLGNPFPFALSILQKRKLIRLLVAIYKQKGTAPGIINAVRFFTGAIVTITTFTGTTMLLGISELGVDWILGPGTSFALYSFRIVSAGALTQEQIDQITFIANYMKPAHTHLIEIVVPTTPPVYDPVELGISELGVDWLLH